MSNKFFRYLSTYQFNKSAFCVIVYLNMYYFRGTKWSVKK